MSANNFKYECSNWKVGLTGSASTQIFQINGVCDVNWELLLLLFAYYIYSALTQVRSLEIEKGYFHPGMSSVGFSRSGIH